MRIISLMVALLVTIHSGFAQKTEYKDGTFTTDGQAVAKMIKSKNAASLGMVNDFEIKNNDGTTLIIAVLADEFPEDPKDNMNYYFKLTFVGLDKTGFFKVSKLGTEKSLGKLLSGAGIFKDGALDQTATFNFIARQGKTPPMKTNDYVLIQRNKSWPIELKEGKQIEQDGKVIGQWIDNTPSGSNVDQYDFALPSGLKVASVSFTGGNNAQSCEMITLKDGRKQNVGIPSSDNVKMLMSSIDRNQKSLERIVKWLVQNQYL